MALSLARLLLAGLWAALPAASHVRLGPEGCVTVDRSRSGTCVLATRCQGVDTSRFEFAFNCRGAKGDLSRHSFGVGGFDEEEEFDTGVACRSCERPADLAKKAHVEKKVVARAAAPRVAPSAASHQAAEAPVALAASRAVAGLRV